MSDEESKQTFGIARNEATFMHNQHFEGITQEYAGFAHALGWGLNLNYLASGAIPRTTISNPSGAGLGTTQASDMALGGGYGRALTETLALGAGVKLIRESIAGYSGQALALDLGALWATPRFKDLTLGAALQNIGPGVRFQSRKESLPLNLRTGAAYRFSARGQEGLLSLDLTKERSESPLVSVGAETRIAQVMPIRLGFGTRNDAGPGVTAGVGWMLRDVSLDYAFVPYGDLGISHRFSVTWRFGEDLRREQDERDRLERRHPGRKDDQPRPRKRAKRRADAPPRTAEDE
ncbi:MAG: PorV/PorQ family protein, partial [Elusimicrobiota bacterium]